MNTIRKCLAMITGIVVMLVTIVGCSKEEKNNEVSETVNLNKEYRLLLDDKYEGRYTEALERCLFILEKIKEQGLEDEEEELYKRVNSLIGDLYSNGDLGYKDEKTALIYYEKGEEGDRLSVAMDYLSGENEYIEQNVDKAIQLLEELVEDGYALAESWLDRAYAQRDKTTQVVDVETEKETEESTTQKVVEKDTTQKQTTEKQTAQKQTTEKQTTQKQTTEKQTTEKQTTQKPTTQKPSVEEQTTTKNFADTDMGIEEETLPPISTDRTTLKGMLGAYLKQASTGKIDKGLFHNNQQIFLSNLTTSSTTMKELGFVNGYTYNVKSIMIMEPGTEMKWDVVMEKAFEIGYVPLMNEKAFHEGINWMAYMNLKSMYFEGRAICTIDVDGNEKICNIDFIYVIDGGKYYMVDAKVVYNN